MIYSKIRELCKINEISINKLEAELQFARGSLCKIDKNKPSSERLQKIAEYLNVSADYLTGISEFKTKEEWREQLDKTNEVPRIKDEIYKYEHGMIINVLGQVAAGVPIEAVEEIIDTEEISEELAKSGNFFGLQIHGDSMEPRMCEGDVVIVRQQEDAESGDIVIALVNGEEATCKRLVKYAEGISLASFNSKYEPMYFSNLEIQEKPIKIIGRVVELRGKF